MLDYAQLDALRAVLRTGSFEAAAGQLGLTQPAISLRIKHLEDRVGAVLVQRGQPCRATQAGAQLANHADTVRLMERNLVDGLAPDTDPAHLRIAVNADSLATWFLPALPTHAAFLYDLVIDDQDHSADWLRRGEVAAAVTGNPDPVRGCDSHPLGLLRYHATASPVFVERYFPDGVTAASLAQAPVLAFNAKDRLQADWASGIAGRRLAMPTHHLASSEGFVQAARLGIGWGMNPEQLIAQDLAAGTLVKLVPEAPMDVAHHWQVSRVVNAPLKELTKNIRARARAALLR